jgi:hypothetical protein
MPSFGAVGEGTGFEVSRAGGLSLGPFNPYRDGGVRARVLREERSMHPASGSEELKLRASIPGWFRC